MNFSLTLKPDEAYYKEAYSEMISTLKLKKYEPIFAIIMILFGLGLNYFDSKEKLGLFPLFFSAVGAYELYKSYYEKKKWLKDRLSTGVVGKTIELEFSDNEIKHSGPFSSGEFIWDGLKSITKTQNGILLKPQAGVSIYLPNSAFTNQKQIDFILSKKKSE
jgi:hypothetical protein